MHSTMNMLSKLIMLALLAVAGLAIWLLPKTTLVTGRRIGEKLFVVTYAVGVICGAAGLAAIFIWPEQVFEWHLMELSVAPLVLVYAYWLAVMRGAKTSQVTDEKQDADLARAGGLAWALTCPAMLVAFQLSLTGRFNPTLWFPYYLLVTLLLHSVATLYFFKRQ
jgi:hypothetical protein